MYKKISMKDFSQWLSRLRIQAQVFGPEKKSGLSAYREWKNGDLPGSFLNSRLSPKALFFEPLKPLFGWKSEGGSLKVDPFPSPDGWRVILDVRPCDARAIRVLEPVFGGNLPDAFYLGNLSRTILLGLACRVQCPGSFCEEMGIDPQESADCDILFREVRQERIAKIVTEKGKTLVEGSDFFQESSQEEWESAGGEIRDRRENSLFDLQKVKERMAQRFGEEDFWRHVSAKCLNCGICTYLCPTCHCFDICDLQVPGQGARYRCWDSCAFPSFTRMPVHNPREEKWRRYRQRVAHKFYFYPQNFRMVSCVGCGRCVSHCPVNLDLREVLLEVAR
jgi:sulfhydrogenase subunit beta (sulfur reductase)